MGSDCSERVCPFGVSFVDTPRGDLNHDGVVSSTASGASISFATEANRITNLVETPLGISQVQWSNKLEYEYFPNHVDTTTGYINGNNNENMGGLVAQNEEAHFYNECSGKGLCDRAAGLCKCFDGYTGSACQRTTCPNDCSGHGVCLTVKEIAEGSRISGSTSGRNYRVTDYYAGTNVYTGVATSFEYNLWDADKNQACVCDRGYFGADCSQRECPRGNDPLTNEVYHCGNADCAAEVQAMYIWKPTAVAQASGVSVRLGYTDKYADSTVTLYSQAFVLKEGRTARDYQEVVQAALASFPNSLLSGVTVSINSVTEAATGVASHLRSSTKIDTQNDGVELKLDFARGPQGDVNAITMENTEAVNANHMAYTTVSADSSGTSGPTRVAGLNGAYLNVGTTVNNANIPAFSAFMTVSNGNTEASPCSNRGLCDYATGTCKCFTGYTTENCGVQSALAA